MSGSLAPPLCAISVARTARMHDFLADSGHFGVSILSQRQQRLSTHFAGCPDPDLTVRFDYIGRTPVLADAAGTIAAEIVTTHECGDHSIIIGRIIDLQARNKAPLLVHRGRYASLSYAAETAAGATIEFW
jgi:flavin reductase